MKKLGLVIVDGVGFRNFIISNFLNEASNNFDEIVIYSGLKESVYDLEYYKNVKVIELEIYKESRITNFYRKLNEVAHLYRHNSFYGITDTLNFTKPKGYSKRAILNKFIRIFAFIFQSEKYTNAFQKLIYKSFSKNKVARGFIRILNQEKPNILFFTHQRPPYIAPLVYAANVMNIKTCSFIFSWDNLTSKGRMPAMFDTFFVWSDLMKNELKYFYPFIDKKNIYVIGTPQFEPYIMDNYKTSLEGFYKRFKLDRNKKTICFSCGDLSTGGNDELSIKIIANAILEDKINTPVNLVVRTSPADDGSRFNNLKKRYPFIIWNKPKWIQTRKNHIEPWSQRVPLKEDIKDLRAILEFSDISINMCSTMSLDFMIFNKPVINQVIGNKTNGLFDDQRFLNYDHYKKVVESGAVAIAKNEIELIEVINTTLEQPNKKIKQQNELIQLQISKPLKGTSKRIVEVLLKLSE